jgi:hypothetical protein
MKMIKLSFLFFVKILFTNVAFAQLPSNDPANATGCSVQALGGNGSGSNATYYCYACGSTAACPAVAPCPYCWELAEQTNNPGIFEISIFLPNGNTNQYIGKNIDFTKLYNANNEWIGHSLNFEIVEVIEIPE